jgi:hypothetical protein
MEGVHDEGVAPIEFDNVPTEGFVLNKKAGGYSSGWNHRQTYSRVYDPRGWEFEITVPNLLYILQECSSFKGKGLEGQFVYSWAGKDLVLLPVLSPDYVACEDFTNTQSMKIGKKDLAEGHTYLTSKMEKLVYLGYYPVYEDTWNNKTAIECKYDEDDFVSKSRSENKHVFKVVLKTEPQEIDDEDDEDYDVKSDIRFEFLSSFSRLKKKVSDVVDPNFANWVDAYLKSEYASLADHVIVVPLHKDFFKSLRWEQKVFKFGEINSVKDLTTAEREIKESEEQKGKYAVYKKVDGYSLSSYRPWNSTKPTPEEIIDEDAARARYGKLVRVYKNGYKKNV